MIHITIPKQAEHILRVLQENNFEAYVVGGCVRDSIMGRKPKDWDITTSASPLQVKALFGRTIDTGLQHGTVTIMIDHEGYEVTTFRVDGEYEDSRHPKEVIFTSSLEEDLKRRDLTINAMAYSPKEGLVDLFGGMDDIQNKIIRCVGDPIERFGEDALRMMRAIRFAAQLGFSIDEETKQAIKTLAPTLERISAERIQVELIKTISSPNPEMIETAYECGITQVILPEFDRIMEQRQHSPHHAYSVGIHTIKAMQNIPQDKVLRLTMLFHDMGKPDVFMTDENGKDHFRGHAAYSAKTARSIMKRLKFDTDTLNTVCTLVAEHSRYPQVSGHDIRKTAYELGGAQMFEALLQVKRADILAQNPCVIQKKLCYLEEVKRVWRHVLMNNDCLSIKELQLTGKDLIEDGMKPGKSLGDVLQQLFEEVLEHPENNTRQVLLARSRELRKGEEE